MNNGNNRKEGTEGNRFSYGVPAALRSEYRTPWQARPVFYFEADEGSGGGTSTDQGDGSGDANNRAGGDAQSGGEKPSLGWRAGLPTDLRDHELVKDKTAVSDFVRQALDWHGRANSAVVTPGKDATPEQQAAYYSAIGVPQKPDDYELDRSAIPEGVAVDEGFEKWFRSAAIGAHVPKESAQALYRAYNEYQGEQLKGFARQVQEGTQALQNELGDKYKPTIERVQKMFSQFGSKDAQQAIMNATYNGVRLGNIPEVVKAFAIVADKVGEDAFVRGGTDKDAGGAGESGGWNFPNTKGMKE